jgi:hypothetical protein
MVSQDVVGPRRRQMAGLLSGERGTAPDAPRARPARDAPVVWGGGNRQRVYRALSAPKVRGWTGVAP